MQQPRDQAIKAFIDIYNASLLTLGHPPLTAEQHDVLVGLLRLLAQGEENPLRAVLTIVLARQSTAVKQAHLQKLLGLRTVVH